MIRSFHSVGIFVETFDTEDGQHWMVEAGPDEYLQEIREILKETDRDLDVDYVFVKRHPTANEGDLVIALFDGKNNLKKLGFDPKKKKYVLHSCNPDMKAYPDIIVDELQIQGVVKGSYHKH